MINVGIIDNDKTAGEIVYNYLSKEKGFRILFWADSFQNIPMNKIDELDIVLCDLDLPGKSGVEVAWSLKHKKPNIFIVMLITCIDGEKIFQSLQVGISGYLLKNTPLHKIKQGLLEVMKGGGIISPKVAKKVVGYLKNEPKKSTSDLTKREIEVLQCIKIGNTNQQTADSLGIGIDTVKFHVKNIYGKLQVKTRSELYDY